MIFMYLIVLSTLVVSFINYNFSKKIKQMIDDKEYVLLKDRDKQILMYNPNAESKYKMKTLNVYDVIYQLVEELEEDGISVLQYEEDQKVHEQVEKNMKIFKLQQAGKITWDEYYKLKEQNTIKFYFSYESKEDMYTRLIDDKRKFKKSTHSIYLTSIKEFLENHTNNNQELIDLKNAFKNKIKDKLSNHLVKNMNI